jgi:hypothetical protein
MYSTKRLDDIHRIRVFALSSAGTVDTLLGKRTRKPEYSSIIDGVNPDQTFYPISHGGQLIYWYVKENHVYKSVMEDRVVVGGCGKAFLLPEEESKS